MGCAGSKADDTTDSGKTAEQKAPPAQAAPPKPPAPMMSRSEGGLVGAKETDPGAVVLNVHAKTPDAEEDEPEKETSASEAEREAAILNKFANKNDDPLPARTSSADAAKDLPPLSDLPESLAEQVSTLGTRSILMDDPLRKCLKDIATQAPLDEKAFKCCDARLAIMAKTLGTALLKTLSIVDFYKAFAGMPKMMETTRTMIGAAPARGVTNLIGTALIKDVEATSDAYALECTLDVLQLMVGEGRMKAELGTGFDAKFDIPDTHKEAYNSAIAKAKARLEAVKAS